MRRIEAWPVNRIPISLHRDRGRTRSRIRARRNLPALHHRPMTFAHFAVGQHDRKISGVQFECNFRRRHRQRSLRHQRSLHWIKSCRARATQRSKNSQQYQAEFHLHGYTLLQLGTIFSRIRCPIDCSDSQLSQPFRCDVCDLRGERFATFDFPTANLR